VNNHTLQPTALVNEAYMRLADQKSMKWQNRAQFYGIAAQADAPNTGRSRAFEVCGEARWGGTAKAFHYHGGEAAAVMPDLDVLALHEALEELATIDPQQARIVELKFFGGLSIEETAEVMSLGHATVERDWKMARAWLRRKLE
jgi:RNA polymerase sigma factor (TIGR02999 family)